MTTKPRTKKYLVRPLRWTQEGDKKGRSRWGVVTPLFAYMVVRTGNGGNSPWALDYASVSSGYSEWESLGTGPTLAEVWERANLHHKMAVVAEFLEEARG